MDNPMFFWSNPFYCWRRDINGKSRAHAVKGYKSYAIRFNHEKGYWLSQANDSFEKIWASWIC